MAGLVGICGCDLSTSGESVSKAVQTTVYSQKNAIANLHHDNNFILAKSFFDFFDQAELLHHAGHIHIWIDGEIYNENKPGETSALLVSNYQNATLESFLKKVDGVFIGIIYDSTKKLVIVITDRYGLKPFYFYHRDRKLIMTPELKSFLCFKEFDLKFRKDLMDCFIDLGHLMGSDTWFEGVELAEPSSMYIYDIENDTLSKRKYWTWADNPRNSVISIDDAAREMSSLLRKAVKSRAQSNKSIQLGISLSGGLDSRAILASVYKDTPVFTYTFGLPESADVMIAKAVAKVAHVKNKHFEINVSNWLESRFQSVWKTDGMLNMLHMHYPHILNEVQKIIDINLSGFSGDLVLGGSYLEKIHKIFFSKKFLNKRITAEIARFYYGRHYERCDLQDSYFDIDCIDPYLIYNRCRRFVIMGIEEPSKLIPQQMPFMANELLELSYSLPDEYRFNSRVYNKALLQLEPALFATIPSASTRMLVSEEYTFINNLRSQLSYYFDLVKQKLGKPITFANYHSWIKEPGTAKLIGDLLNPRTAIYSQFTDKNYNELFLQPHLKGPRMFTQKVLSALTIELWLQQIFNKRYFNDVNH